MTAPDRLDDLEFLVGRWVGTGPDGKPFYEAYVRDDANTLRSERHADASFSQATDGSTVTVTEGEVKAIWGEYSWRADRIAPGFASFVPANAPSAFTWKKIDDDTVEVTQNWTDDAGTPQSYALRLLRAK